MQLASDRVLVRGHIPRWMTICRNLSLIAVVIGALLFAVDVWVAVGVLSSALVALIALQITIVVRRGKQMWVTDTGDGFILEDREGRREHGDEDVYGLDMELKNIYSEGTLKSVRRVFRMKVQDEPKEVEFINNIKLGEVDPLANFIQRIVDDYRDQASEGLQAGAKVSGKNWTMSASELTIEGKAAQVIPLESISSVGVYDQQVCLWKVGEPEAFLKLPVRSKNAFLLQLIISDRLAKTETQPADVSDLGRVLFERKGHWTVTLLLYGLIGLFCVGMLGLLLSAVGQGDPWSLLGAALLGLVGGLLLWILLGHRRTLFRCHEAGVIQRGMRGEKRLMYDEVDEFTYSATRQYYNGVYIGTALKIILFSNRGEKPLKISFARSVKNADEDLQELSNHISMVLGAKMLQRLADGERVHWTDCLTIVPDGIEYTPSGFIGKKKMMMVPFTTITGFDLQEGTFHVWTEGNKKSVIRESCATKNFFPGYYALQAIFSSAAERA